MTFSNPNRKIMKDVQIYDIYADAEKDIEGLIAQAKVEKKNIMIQAGGNWCIWCIRFTEFLNNSMELKEIIDKNYIYYHLNFSPENEKIFSRYDNPDYFGFPVIIILNENGEKIHIQRTDVLEQNDGYNREMVMKFLMSWAKYS
jgi:thioredoxin-related protein